MKEEAPFEINDYSSGEQPPARWKSALSLVVIVVMVLLLIRVLFALVVPLVSIILLIANRDLVSKIVRMIYNLYQDELYKGLLASLGAFLLFLPFVVFLFFRTVYYLFVEGKKIPSASTAKNNNEADLINIVIKEKMKNLLQDDDKSY